MANKFPNKKKIKRKYISVQKYELTKRNRKSKYSKWVLKLCEWLKVELADTYNYLYRIQYTTTFSKINLSPNTLLVNEAGEYFVVLKEENRLAMIVSTSPSVLEPRMTGRFFVVETPKELKKEANLKKV